MLKYKVKPGQYVHLRLGIQYVVEWLEVVKNILQPDSAKALSSE
jgi:hypothetical protein